MFDPESAPLLGDPERHDELEGQTNSNAPSDREWTRTPTYFKSLSSITLLLSAVTLGLLIVNHIIIRYAPFTGYYWNTLGATVALGQWALISLIFTSINLLVNFALPLNLIADIILAPALIASAFRLLDAFPAEWCRDWYPNPYPEPNPKCKDWELAMKIMTGVAAGLGALLGLVYISMLTLRGAALFKSELWKRSNALRFPTGEISFKISLKFKSFRQEGGETGNAVSQSAEASSSSGHGPLYL